MSALENSGPSPAEGDASGKQAETEFDPSFGGTAVIAVMPHGADAALVQRVQKSLGEALNSEDDPPVVLLVSEDGDPSPSEEGVSIRGLIPLPVVALPIIIKAGKETIEFMAREAKAQQAANHRAQRAHEREVEAYHQRAENWRNKNLQ